MNAVVVAVRPIRRAAHLLSLGSALMLALGIFLIGGGASAYACSELISDGSFTSGAGWQSRSSGGYPLLGNYLTRSAGAAAHLGGVSGAQDWIETQVTLPQAERVELSFWWQIHSEEGGDASDGLSVIATDGSGIDTVLFTLSDRNATSLWKQARIDMSAFAGKTITLRFSAQTDGANITDFFVDDVSLSACSRASLQPRLFLPWSAR